MRQALLYIGLGIVAGIGTAALFGRNPLPGPAPIPGPTTQPERNVLADRVAALETALATETAQRAALQAELTALAEQVGEQRDPAAAVDAQSPVVADDDTVVVEGDGERFAARVAGRRERASPEYRSNQLIEAGFAPDQAQWILDREAQMRLDMLNSQYEARRQGEPFNPLESQLSAQADMREQLGDAMYTQYLEATGQPTSVSVREVLENSPGQTAGLQRGDEIVAYAGQRVFSVVELNELTLGGKPGETVAVDIVRDGQPMQLYVPRGPIGFSSGGRNFAFGRTGFLP